MNVSVTPKLEKLVAIKVRSGPRLHEDQGRLRAVQLEEVHHKVQMGLDQLDRGMGIFGDRVLAEWKQKSAALRKARKGE